MWLGTVFLWLSKRKLRCDFCRLNSTNTFKLDFERQLGKKGLEERTSLTFQHRRFVQKTKKKSERESKRPAKSGPKGGIEKENGVCVTKISTRSFRLVREERAVKANKV